MTHSRLSSAFLPVCRIRLEMSQWWDSINRVCGKQNEFPKFSTVANHNAAKCLSAAIEAIIKKTGLHRQPKGMFGMHPVGEHLKSSTFYTLPREFERFNFRFSLFWYKLFGTNSWKKIALIQMVFDYHIQSTILPSARKRSQSVFKNYSCFHLANVQIRWHFNFSKQNWFIKSHSRKL